MLTPSAETDILPRSELLRTRSTPEAVQLVVDDDAPVVSELTGRSIGPDPTPGVEVPPHLVPVAKRALTLRAERMIVGGTAKARQGAIGSLKLASFSAGPYSESYFGPGQAQQAKALDPDPAVHDLLWALATEERRAYWMRVWGIVVAPEPAAGFVPFVQVRRPRDPFVY